MKVAGLFVVALLALGGCRAQVCAPGATQSCVCPGGAQGAQACSSQGDRWEACSCSQPSEASNADAAAPTAMSAVAQANVPKGAEEAPTKLSGKTEEDVPDLPPGPQPYTVTIVSADIAPSKPDGKPWDAEDGPPDPVVTVWVDGAGSGQVRSSKANNTTSPRWEQSGTVKINRGDRVVITLVDKDAMSDDSIAGWIVIFTRTGRQSLRHESGNSLIVDIEPAK